ncbi:MAG: hypothetical protein AAF065_11885 [Verrucomicrobiota bacterium]
MIDRTLVKRGPCICTYKGQIFFSRGDVTINLDTPMFDKTSAGYGRHGQGLSDKRLTVELQPITFTSAEAAVLVPYASAGIGSSIFGAADSPLVIIPLISDDDQILTIANAAVTTEPNLRFSSQRPLWDSNVTFTGIVGNNLVAALESSYYAFSTKTGGETPGSTWDPTKDIYLPFAGTFGGTSYEALEGFGVTFNSSFSELKPDNNGTTDMFLQTHGAAMSFIPIGITEAQSTALAGNFGTKFGANRTPGDWVIAGPDEGDLRFTLKDTTPGAQNARVYGAESNRLGELNFEAQRTVNAGAFNPLYVFDTVPAA